MNFGNLGIALGAGVDEAHVQRKEAREDAAEKRANEQFGWQREEQERVKKVDEAQKAATESYRTRMERLRQGDHDTLAQELVDQHNGSSYLGDSKSQLVRGADGNLHVIAYPDGTYDGTKAVVQQVTPQMLHQHATDMFLHDLQTADPRSALHNQEVNRTHGLHVGELGVKKQQANTMEGWRSDQAELYRTKNANDYALGQEQNRLRALELSQMAAARAATERTASFGNPLTLYGQGDAPVIVTPVRSKDGKVNYVQSALPADLRFTPKSDGSRMQLDPAARKEFTTALDTMGARPVAKVGFFGGKDDTAGKQWDTTRKQIYENHGVPFSSTGSLNLAPPGASSPYPEDAAPPDIARIITEGVSPAAQSTSQQGGLRVTRNNRGIATGTLNPRQPGYYNQN